MLAGTIWRFWWNRNAVSESTYWYERAFAIGGASPKARARAIFGAAHVAELQGDSERARIEFEQAAELLRDVGETRWQILALAHLSGALDRTGDPKRGEEVLDEAMTLARNTGDVRGAAVINANRGYHALVRRDEEGATRILEEALAGHRAAGDVYGLAVVLSNLAVAAFRRGDLDDAAARLSESLPLTVSIGDMHTLVETMGDAAAVVLARGDTRAAVRLCGANDVLCKAHGYSMGRLEGELLDEALTDGRAVLGAEFEDEWRAGAELDVTRAVELALEALS